MKQILAILAQTSSDKSTDNPVIAGGFAESTCKFTGNKSSGIYIE